MFRLFYAHKQTSKTQIYSNSTRSSLVPRAGTSIMSRNKSKSQEIMTFLYKQYIIQISAQFGDQYNALGG